jgi:hypothetical protein
MNHPTTHMERRKICVIEIGRSDVVVTSMIVVCLLLCALNLMNGQQLVYGLLQRGSPEAGQHVIEPGSHIGGILKGPKPFPGAPGSNIEQGERENNIGPAGPNPSLGPRPGSSEQGEIRRNVGPSAPLNPNATQHIVVPLPPKNVDNNIVICNKVIRSEPLIVENVRQPFITTSQPAEQEAVMIPPPPIYESPLLLPPEKLQAKQNVILGPPYHHLR